MFGISRDREVHAVNTNLVQLFNELVVSATVYDFIHVGLNLFNVSFVASLHPARQLVSISIQFIAPKVVED